MRPGLLRWCRSAGRGPACRCGRSTGVQVAGLRPIRGFGGRREWGR